MLKKKITYTDYNDNERTEEFLFNLSKAEVLEMEMGINGGMTNMIQKLVAEQDMASISKTFKEIIMKAYGEKSLDGKHFIKSPELSTRFTQTEAYTVLFLELLDPKKASEFIEAILPQDAIAQAKAAKDELNTPNLVPVE